MEFSSNTRFMGRIPGGIRGRRGFSGVSVTTTDPRLGFYDLREQDKRGGVSNAGCNCQSCNKTFNAFVSNKRIVHRVLHWEVFRGHYCVTGKHSDLIGYPNNHGRSLYGISPSTQLPTALSIPRRATPSLFMLTLRG